MSHSMPHRFSQAKAECNDIAKADIMAPWWIVSRKRHKQACSLDRAPEYVPLHNALVWNNATQNLKKEIRNHYSHGSIPLQGFMRMRTHLYFKPFLFLTARVARTSRDLECLYQCSQWNSAGYCEPQSAVKTCIMMAHILAVRCSPWRTNMVEYA